MRRFLRALAGGSLIAALTAGVALALNYEGEDFCQDTPSWPNGTYLGQMHPYHSDFYRGYAERRGWDPCVTWAQDQRNSAVRGIRELGYTVTEPEGGAPPPGPAATPSAAASSSPPGGLTLFAAGRPGPAGSAGVASNVNYEGEDFCQDTPSWPNGTYLGQMHPFHVDFYRGYAERRGWDACVTWAQDQRNSAIRGLRELGYAVIEPAGGAPPPPGPPPSRLAFVSDHDGDLEIYVMNADGTGLTQLTHNSDHDSVPAWWPAWSPDGRRLAFASHRDGVWEVYVMNADGTGLTQLTHNSDNNFAPAWSPDGRRLAFLSSRDGDFEIYVMNADGTNQTQLTHTNYEGAGRPAWSPDGRRLAFTFKLDRDGNWEIYVMNADGTGLTQLTHNSDRDSAPVWSPDGRRLAFHSDRDGDREIYVMNADGTGLTRRS